jgi:deoxycytidylate deaminase
VARKSPYESAKPEIVIGIIARMGVDVGAVVESINAESLKYRYKSVHIKLTGFLKDIDHGCNLEVHSTERRYTTYIEACNKARSKAKDAGFFSYLATQTIGLRRSELQAGEHRGIVYIVDQLKRPEEVQTLREIYGDTFIALSCHAPIDVRIQNITDRITGDHPETGKEDFWRSLATQLVDMDEAQDDVFGQAVRSTFPLADFILDSTTKSKIEASTNRLFRILFGDPGMSPTFAEYGNNMAAQAAYRSIDLSRQVGAAIFDDRKKILALGCNEVPAFDGGTYWPSSETDRRDHKIGYDANTIRKRGLVLNVVDLLKSNGSLSEELSELSEQELQTKILDEKTGILRDAEILDILEYGRALHAEMNAITDVARSNSSTQGATLFVTTFPCHNCAKHIVGAGIKEVFYLEPFPKSQVQRLYPDSIEIDPDSSSSKKVIFRQFCGITKRRFALFAKGKLKNSTGKTVDWKEATAKFLIDRLPIDYSRLEEKHSGIAKSLLELVGPNPGSANS